MKVFDISEKRNLLPPPSKRRRLDVNEEARGEAETDCPEGNVVGAVPSVQPGEKAEIVYKKYMHLGVEWGLTGKSPG